MRDEIERVKARMRKPKATGGGSPPRGLSTGSTLLNLACSGKPGWGLAPGQYYFLVGDSGAGKTFLSLTCFAEAAIDPAFKDYRFIFDDVENGALMNFNRFFGPGMADRVEPPAISPGETPVYSSTVEDFYDRLDDAFDDGRPFIYLLDSMDALSTGEEQTKWTANRRARSGDGKQKGTFGVSKAKTNSSSMRVVFNRLRKEGRSILIVLSQTRDNIGFGSQFQPKTRGGGHALTFYAALELWFSVATHLKKTVRGKPREQGVICKVRVKKNRLTGQDRTALVPIYHSYGIDDVGGCVAYLVGEDHWKSNKEVTKVEAPEFAFSGSVEKLVEKIEAEGLEKQLKLLVHEVWQEIEEGCKIKRRRKYGE